MSARAVGSFVASLSILSITTTQIADAAALSWANVAGGSASTAANWSPAQIPVAADTLTFNLPNTFTVTFPGAVPLVTSHTFKRGLVTLSISSPHSTSSFVRVGDVAGDSAQMIVTAGTLHAGTGVTIGNASGATGTLTVDNEGALVDTTGAGSDITVGSGGTGTLNITDGASVQPLDDVIIGSAATGTGTVNVTGTGALPIPIPSSTLNLPNAGQDVTVGSLGSGTLNVSTGARVNADEMFVGLSPGSDGTVTVGGIGGLLDARSQINIATSLHLGDNPTIGASGGAAFFTVNIDGMVNVTGTTRIGDSSGVGAGTLTIHVDSSFTTGSLIATDAGGFLNILGGGLHINGGSLSVRNDVLTLDGTGFPGNVSRVFLENGAACTLSNPVAPFETLIVGHAGQAVFEVESGSDLTISAGDVIIGNLAGSGSQMDVLGAGSTATMPASRFLIIGDAGDGILGVNTGGHLTSGSVNLGRASTGVGTATIYGGGSIWDITGTLAIGGTAAAAFGTGTVDIGSFGSGTVNVTSGGPGTTSVRVWGAGDSLTVGNGGTLSADGDVLVTAAFTLAGGSMSIGRLLLNTAGVNFNLAGEIVGRPQLNSSSSTITLTGDLSIDSGAANLDAIINNGAIEIGDHMLTIDGAIGGNSRNINNCHLGAAGSLVASVPLTIGAGSTLSGDGSVEAPITNAGAILSQGGGLTFSGILSGVGQGISGATIRFADGGGFIGAGTIPTIVVSDAGSTITATGALTLGDPAVSNGANFGGELHVGSHTVQPRSGSDIALGTLTTLAGGTLNGPNSGNPFANFKLTSGDVIEGFGTVSEHVVGLSGSTINATGNLSIAGTRDTIITGSFDGTVNLNGHTVTFVNSPSLGGSVNLGGGTLIAPGVTLGGSLNGIGAVSGSVTNRGEIRPGSPTGFLTITGDHLDGPTLSGLIEIEIAAAGAGNFDRLIVGGNATLTHTTLDIQLLNGFVPAAGAGFTIMTYASHTDAFAAILKPEIPGMCVSVQVNPASVSVVFSSQPANIDGDDGVGLTDLSILLAHFGVSGGVSIAEGDIDNDDDVDLTDLSVLLASFGVSCPA